MIIPHNISINRIMINEFPGSIWFQLAQIQLLKNHNYPKDLDCANTDPKQPLLPI